MAITPDDKDWTWVLTRPCTECAYDAALVGHGDVAAGLRANAARWRPLLEHPDAATRPHPDRWSALEYGCHVRDVFRRFRSRLAVMLDEEDPTFEDWDQDATARADRYETQDPLVVTAELEAAAAALADAFDAVPEDAWDRTGTRSDGARFTTATLGRYLLHDPVHHVWDGEAGYASFAAASA
jgi:hypothetical protein